MSVHTPATCPFMGAVPLEARKVWARLAKGRGHAGICLWPVVLLSRTGPLLLEYLPGCFQRPVCKHSLAGCLFLRTRGQFPRIPCTLLPGLGEKRLG